MKTKIDKKQLVVLVLNGITTEELNSKYEYSHIKDMSYMFEGYSKLMTIPHLDTSNVTDMSGMFRECPSLTSIPLLDTSNVKDMYGMFDECSNLTSIPLLNTSNVTDMRYMFYECHNLREVDPYNFKLYNWTELDNEFLKEKYPELYI